MLEHLVDLLGTIHEDNLRGTAQYLVGKEYDPQPRTCDLYQTCGIELDLHDVLSAIFG